MCELSVLSPKDSTMESDNSRTHNTKESSTKRSDLGELLPIDFHPGPYDVVFERGRRGMRYEGNANFHKLIKAALPKYSEAIRRWEKSKIVTAIVETIKNKSKGGGFVRRVKDRWYVVGTSRTRR